MHMPITMPQYIVWAFRLVKILQGHREDCREELNWAVTYVPVHQKFYCTRLRVDDFEQHLRVPQRTFKQLVAWGILLPSKKSEVWVPKGADDFLSKPARQYVLNPLFTSEEFTL